MTPIAPDASLFGADNLPYCVFSIEDGPPAVGVRIADDILDLGAALGDEVFRASSLNPLMSLGPDGWQRARKDVQQLVNGDSAHARRYLHPMSRTSLHLPFEVADFVDFYASRHHAENMGRMLRPSGEPLLPNWLHLPVAYHGRAGTVVVSGTRVRRPSGLRVLPGTAGPEFGPSTRLDIEAEVGFVVGVGSAPGHGVAPDEFSSHVFGVVLVNDWSARDIQAFEAQPLGPMLAKSFATSISAFVTPLEALSHARIPGPAQSPTPAAYLRSSAPFTFDIALEVRLNGERISGPCFKDMYWTPAQQLSHMTANGAPLRTGDLFASGTVSGPEPESQGCLMEITWRGERPITLSNGTTRTFLDDGDLVSISATAPGRNGRIGLGEVSGVVVA